MIQAILVAGDTLAWTETDPVYLASDGYNIKYCLLKTDKQINIESSADGEIHSFAVSSAISAAWEAGEYSFHRFAVKDDERYFLSSGSLTIQADPLTQEGGSDTRSWIKRTLDEIRAVIESRATDAVLEREVDGTKLKYWSVGSLLDLEAKLQARYRAEQGNIDLPPSLNLTLRGYH